MTREEIQRWVEEPENFRWLYTQYIESSRKASLNHAAYIAKFYESHVLTVRNLTVEADGVREHRLVDFPKDDRRVCLEVFTPLFLAHYVYLMDHLDEDEEKRYRLLSRQVSEAWDDFFAAVRASRPQLADFLDETAAHQDALQREVMDLFLGETEAAFTAEWAQYYGAFDADLERISEELKK